MFDNEIVCLGTDINAADGGNIETTVENRKLSASGDNALTVDGAAAAASIGASETVTAAWAHLAGNDSESDGIGYFFPKKETLNIVRESRTNNWSSMNQAAGQKDDTDYTDNYLTMYINHGVTPSNADYEYVLLPNMSSDGVKAMLKTPMLKFLQTIQMFRRHMINQPKLPALIFGAIPKRRCKETARIGSFATVRRLLRYRKRTVSLKLRFRIQRKKYGVCRYRGRQRGSKAYFKG